jgi:hypothetical protein
VSAACQLEVRQLVRGARAHHQVFNREIGRNGIVYRRANWESLYSLDQLELALDIGQEKMEQSSCNLAITS